MKKVRIKK